MTDRIKKINQKKKMKTQLLNQNETFYTVVIPAFMNGKESLVAVKEVMTDDQVMIVEGGK